MSAKKFFEKLGKELDQVVADGESALKDFEKVIEKEFSEEKLKEKQNMFEDMVKDIDNDLSDLFDSISKEVKEAKETKISKYKIFNIKMVEFEKAIIKYKKKSNKISIGKKGSDKSFDIQLVDGISKKKVLDILETVDYNEDTNIISIKIKRKNLIKS